VLNICEGTVVGGKYRLERALAKGGMGAVWVGQHIHLAQRVAVKFILQNALPESSDALARFEREAKAVAALNSRHVVTIHDFGIDDGTPYLVMELLEGEDLGVRLKRDRALAPSAVYAIVVQVARALRKAHEAGMIHRDIKPANLFIAKDDDEEVVKILDFGLVKAIGLPSEGDATRTDMIVGSLHYLSPEQARGRKDLDARSDLWSVGVLAFRALTGRLPFPGSDALEVLSHIALDDPPLLSQLAPGLPVAFDAFFARALAREPSQRFQSATELAEGFRLAMESSAAPDVAPEVPPAASAGTEPSKSDIILSATSGRRAPAEFASDPTGPSLVPPSRKRMLVVASLAAWLLVAVVLAAVRLGAGGTESASAIAAVPPTLSAEPSALAPVASHSVSAAPSAPAPSQAAPPLASAPHEDPPKRRQPPHGTGKKPAAPPPSPRKIQGPVERTL
jgi:eukaryotic-like serine/threonine-protein kinase